MTEPSQDLFDPSLVFVEETTDRNAVQEHNEYIGNLVLAALHAKKQIAVITSGEEFNANVAKVSSKDGIFQFEFEQCELDDSVFLQQRVYKATDIVDIREPIPTRWQQEADTTRQMTQPQSPPQASPMEQTQESQDSNKPEQPTQKSVPRTPRHDIDIDYLKLLWIHSGEKDKDFTMWCDDQGYGPQMRKEITHFGISPALELMLSENITNGLLHYNLWISTFDIHKMQFDGWMESDCYSQPLPNYDIRPQEKVNLDILRLQYHAIRVITNALEKDKDRLTYLFHIWRSGLVISHAEPFHLWISNAEKAKYLPGMIQKVKPFERITLADIRPYDVIFDFDESLKLHHQEITTAFILDANVKAVFTNEKSEISPDLFYPGAPLGKYHIPNYIYVQPEILEELGVHYNIDELPHIKYLMWNRLKQAQITAYRSDYKFWADYIVSNMDTITPFVSYYRMLVPDKLPRVTQIQVVQHIQAYKHWEDKRGSHVFDKQEFYDLFLRPLEFLVAQGTPLHTMLIESIHNYIARCSLFKLLLETAGFTIYDDIPVNPNFVYSELTRVRCLNAQQLSTTLLTDSPPLHRLEPMPRVTNISRTRPMSKIIEPKDFEPANRFGNYKPHKFIPLDESILKQFPQLDGTQMPLCDQFALHCYFIKIYEQYNALRFPSSPSAEDPWETKSGQVSPNKQVKYHGQDIDRSQEATAQWVDMIDTFKPQDPLAQRLNPISEQPIPLPAIQQMPETPTQMISLSFEQLKQLVHEKPIEQQQQKQQQLLQPQPEASRVPIIQNPPKASRFPTPSTSRPRPLSRRQPQQQRPDQQILPRPKYHPTINPLPQTPSWDPRSVASEKIYPTSLIWSCTDHYNIPTWAKIAHSAISLYESVDHSATNLLLTGTDEKARHREMPHFRQLPADGLNFLHDVQIYMQGGRKAEIIHLKVTKTEFSRFGKNKSRIQTGKEHIRTLQFPTYFLARFILAFFDIAKVQLPPAMNDVQQEGHVLLHKQIHCQYCMFDFTIIIQAGPNGLERMLHLILDDEKTEDFPPPVEIPWIRMAEVLTGLRRVHEDLQQSGFI
jgi:hypothetical protein